MEQNKNEKDGKFMTKKVKCGEEFVDEIGRIIEREQVVVLFSGGADSTLLLHFAGSMNYIPFCVLMDYGQLHKEELEYAEKFCVANLINYKIVSISGYDVPSGLTTGDKGIYEGVHSHNVPARNSIFLSIAAGVAEAIGAKKVWIGCDYSDRIGLFPDCYQEYFVKVNEMFQIAFSYPITVEAPLLGFSKQMVLDMLEKHYCVKSEDLYTGYREFA
jgi:7-cyano-7-deazaguanine synthase